MAQRSNDGEASPARVRRGAGELESQVLRTLWTAGGPMTPAALHAELGTDLAYNTVHTVLTRLCDKGVLDRATLGGRPAYVPAQSRAEYAAAQMRAVLDRGGDHAAILQRFVDSLSAEDEAALRAVLHDGSDAAPR